jgi:hypothetical protein
MHIEQVEMNTIVTFLGMLCASVQVMTGAYALYYRKRIALIKTNEILHRAHRAFGGFATTLYFLGLFAGVNGLIGALTVNQPPLELQSPSFNIHTWGSFPVLAIVLWKTYLSYFNKQALYRKRKWLGLATFLAWAYNWISAAISYYVRTQPGNLQHPPPNFLLPYRLMSVQLALPFLIGGAIGWVIVRKAIAWQETQEARRAARSA